MITTARTYVFIPISPTPTQVYACLRRNEVMHFITIRLISIFHLSNTSNTAPHMTQYLPPHTIAGMVAWYLDAVGSTMYSLRYGNIGPRFGLVTLPTLYTHTHSIYIVPLWVIPPSATYLEARHTIYIPTLWQKAVTTLSSPSFHSSHVCVCVYGCR